MCLELNLFAPQDIDVGSSARLEAIHVKDGGPKCDPRKAWQFQTGDLFRWRNGKVETFLLTVGPFPSAGKGGWLVVALT